VLPGVALVLTAVEIAAASGLYRAFAYIGAIFSSSLPDPLRSAKLSFRWRLIDFARESSTDPVGTTRHSGVLSDDWPQPGIDNACRRTNTQGNR